MKTAELARSFEMSQPGVSSLGDRVLPQELDHENENNPARVAKTFDDRK